MARNCLIQIHVELFQLHVMGFLSVLLLLLAGDTEINSGPVGKLNICSLRIKAAVCKLSL